MSQEENTKEDDGIPLNSWEEFKKKIPAPTDGSNSILFRGQANEELNLESSLLRFNQAPTGKRFSIKTYHAHLKDLAKEIAREGYKKWNITDLRTDDWDPLCILLGENNDFSTLQFIAYLRHHGYPTPFLDWSQDPFIAAFFAFQNIAPKVKRVSVFSFQEMTTSRKSARSWKISRVGNNLNVHPRHKAQKSEYTICGGEFEWEEAVRFNIPKNDSNEIYFRSHQEFFERQNFQSPYTQDVITKYTLPASEREKVMAELDHLMNINAFSLFGTEDALMQTLAERNLPRS